MGAPRWVATRFRRLCDGFAARFAQGESWNRAATFLTATPLLANAPGAPRFSRPALRESAEPPVGFHWGSALSSAARSPAIPHAQAAVNVRQLLDSIPGMMMFVMTAEGLPEYINQPLLTALGAQLEDFCGAGWHAFVHPDDARPLADAWAAAIRAGCRANTEFRLAPGNGNWRWVHCCIEPCRDAYGRIQRWYGSVVDVDDRRRAEETMRKTKSALRQIIETVPALVWRATPNGEVDYTNRRLAAYTGESLETLRASGWTSLIHPDDRESSLQGLRRSFATGDSYEVTYRLRDTQGVYRWFEVRAEPLRNAEGVIEHWYGVLVDIDERRQLQAELLHTQQRLAKASHIAIAGELSASIAHEMNQPLAALAANADACERWLTSESPNLERARRSLQSIQRDIAGTGSIVRRMRALFKQTVPVKVPLNINEVITEVRELLLEESVHRGSMLTLDLAASMPSTLADGIQIQQVLINLINNSLDAMGAAASQSGTVLIRSRRAAMDLVVEVLDSGTGFHDADRLFEAFFTTKTDGMGMGLAICRSIIDAHGGRIWAAPRVPVGSVFSFSIPLLT